MAIRVIVADDHALVRDGVRAVIDRIGGDIRIAGEVTNGREVLKIAEDRPVDVYVLDISMPILNGIETTDRLIKKDPQSKVVILSMHDDRRFVEKALRCGARGYVLKDGATEEVVRAIRTVHGGGFYLSDAILKYIVRGFLGKRGHYEEYAKVVDLTAREKEVLQLIAEGFANKDIGRELHLSPNTVNVHRKSIMRKLDIHKQADLIRYAFKEGISQL